VSGTKLRGLFQKGPEGLGKKGGFSYLLGGWFEKGFLRKPSPHFLGGPFKMRL